MAKKIYEVEIKGKKEKAYFETKEQAETYAITMTAWVSGKYIIKAIYVGEGAVSK